MSVPGRLGTRREDGKFGAELALIKVLAYAFVLALSACTEGKDGMCVWCAIYIFMPLGNVLWMSLTPLEDLIFMSRLFLDGPLRALGPDQPPAGHRAARLACKARRWCAFRLRVLYTNRRRPSCAAHIGTLPVQFCLGCAIAQIACYRR